MGKRTIETGIAAMGLLYLFGQMVGRARGAPSLPQPLPLGIGVVAEEMQITAEMEPALMEAAETGRGIYAGGINLPPEDDWVTRLQDYSDYGGQMFVNVSGDYAYVHFAGTGYSDPEVLGGPYATPQKIYIGSAGWQYALIATAASVPIWSGVMYGSAIVPIGSRTNIEFLTRYKTNP